MSKLAEKYRLSNDGLDALAEEEATGEQLAGLLAKAQLDVVLFADFGVLRPFGNRLRRTLKYTAKLWNADSCSYEPKELPGPPDFEEWRRSWRVYRYALLVLGIATSSHLERYYERVAHMYQSYGRLAGQELWWIVAQAETRMRAERFEGIRRKLEREDAKLVASGRASECSIDPKMP